MPLARLRKMSRRTRRESVNTIGDCSRISIGCWIPTTPVPRRLLPVDDAEKEARDICQGVHHGEDAGAFCLCDQIAHALREAKAEQKIIEDDLRDRLRQATERKSVVEGKSGDLGGCRIIKKITKV